MSEATATQINHMLYVVFVHLTSLPTWLQLSRPQRRKVVAEHIRPALDAFPAVRVRWIDAEGFTGTCSDVLMADTDDLRAWNHLFERLRDSPLFAVPYFRLDQIIVGAEDAYLDYESSINAEAS
jgi:chlorite dismutase